MAAMHWCTCRINLSGQNLHINVYDPYHPLSWPEVQVLSVLHGEDNIYDIRPCAVADGINPADEKRRLWAKYGNVVEQVFPGRVFRMELTMPGHGISQRHADDEGVAIAEMPPMHDPEYHPAEDNPGPAVFKPKRPGQLTPSPNTLQRS